jgi:hypothetical protein
MKNLDNVKHHSAATSLRISLLLVSSFSLMIGLLLPKGERPLGPDIDLVLAW